MQLLSACYEEPRMSVIRFSTDGEARTDVIIDSDGSKWTGWYDLGNPEGPGIGE